MQGFFLRTIVLSFRYYTLIFYCICLLLFTKSNYDYLTFPMLIRVFKCCIPVFINISCSWAKENIGSNCVLTSQCTIMIFPGFHVHWEMIKSCSDQSMYDNDFSWISVHWEIIKSWVKGSDENVKHSILKNVYYLPVS